MAKTKIISRQAQVISAVTLAYLVILLCVAAINDTWFPDSGCLIDAGIYTEAFVIPPLFLIPSLIVYAMVSLVRGKAYQMLVLIVAAVFGVLLLGGGILFQTCIAPFA